MGFVVDVSLVEDSLGRPLTVPEQGQVRVWAGEAAALIEQRLQVPAASLDQGLLQIVVRWAVIDMIKRPDAATEVTTSVDDASSTRRYEKSAGRVTILDEWLALLTADRADDSGAFTIRPFSYRPLHLHRHPHAW